LPTICQGELPPIDRFPGTYDAPQAPEVQSFKIHEVIGQPVDFEFTKNVVPISTFSVGEPELYIN